jgi:hypothetical protein
MTSLEAGSGIIPFLRGMETCHADGDRGNDVTLVKAAFFIPSAICAISVLWLLAYLPLNFRARRMNEVRGLDDLDDLGWKVWTFPKGWPSWTCWPGCAGLHRDDWWSVYLYRTCWHGCKDLHRDDWWRAYLDQVD